MTGERGGFASDAFHKIAVAALGVGVVVEQIEAGAVVSGTEPLGGDRHTDAVAATLAEGAGGGFYPRGVAMLGVAGCGTAPLAEIFQVVERNREPVVRYVASEGAISIRFANACDMQHRINQHRSMAAGEDIAIAVGPKRRGRIVVQHFGPQLIGDRGKRHRRARVATPGGFNTIHRQGADRVDGQFGDVFTGGSHAF